MGSTEGAIPSSADQADSTHLSVRQAAFIGVGAMVGAGIFALLGAAGEVAGAAVWLSFLIAGFVAVLQGAFLGFGIITFTAKDLARPARQLPRAMYLALGSRPSSTWPSRWACSARSRWTR